MALGFEAFPAPIVAVGRGAVSGGVRGAVRGGAQQAWQGAGLPGQAPTSVAGGKKLLAAEAQNLKRKTLQDMGLPDIDIKWPTDLTAEGVKDAVYASAKPYLENAAKAATGFPIPFPKKLTLKELENMVGSIFPTNAIEALNLALGLGVQLAASALTSVLAGTAIGSAIPGLGTVVGFVVGLAVASLKGLFFKAPTHPEGRECKFGNPRVRAGGCPQPPANLNVFQFFTWTSQQMQPLWDGLRQYQQTHPCGRGGAINCVRGLSYMRDVAFGMSLSTVDQMGLPALETAFAEISKAPDIQTVPSAGAGFGQGAVTFVTGFRGTQPVSAELRPIYDAKGRLVVAMQQRRAKLQAYIQLATTGQVSPDSLLREMQTAAIQVQNNPSADAIKWLAMLTGFFQQATRTYAAGVEQRTAAARAAAVAHESRIQTDPLAKAAQIRTNRALCSGGNAAACAELQRLGGGAPPAPAPTPVPGQPGLFKAPARPFAPSIPKAPAVDPARAFCWALLDGWAKQNPAKARCLGPSDRARILDLCYQAHGLKKLTLEQSVWKIQDVVDAACARSARRPAVIPSVPRMSARYV